MDEERENRGGGTDAGAEDFLIEDGVLLRYAGPGGNVTVPAGVREIGRKAFFQRGKAGGPAVLRGQDAAGFAGFEAEGERCREEAPQLSPHRQSGGGEEQVGIREDVHVHGAILS